MGLAPWLAGHAAGGSEVRLGSLIDHTLLRPEATETDVDRLCDEAVALGLGAVCLNGQWVGRAAHRPFGRRVRVVAVAGFPLGAATLPVKALEARLAVLDGADEVDVMMSLGWARAGRWDEVENELGVVVEAARGRLVKVILETAALSPEEIERGCQVAMGAGAGAVKTSSGFHPAGGATVEAVRLMRRVVGERLSVKASGGIRTVDQALRLLAAGADRIGTSAAGGWLSAVGRPLSELLSGEWGTVSSER